MNANSERQEPMPQALRQRIDHIRNELRKLGTDSTITATHTHGEDGRLYITGTIGGRHAIYRTGMDGTTLTSILIGRTRIHPRGKPSRSIARLIQTHTDK